MRLFHRSTQEDKRTHRLTGEHALVDQAQIQHREQVNVEDIEPAGRR